MSTPEQAIITTMYEAFAAKDLDALAATVTEDSIWIQNGTQRLDSVRYEGKEAVRKFFEQIFETLEVVYFDVQRTLQVDDTVIVFGRERFKMVGTDSELAQKWVQVYTVREGLIAGLDEYATATEESAFKVVT